jgi:hypothetical protein
MQRLHTWDVPVIGPSIRSSDTGSQWDQVFVCGEQMLSDGVGATLIPYYSAIKIYGERPANHRLPDGSPLRHDSYQNPRLVFWDGRPHTNPGVNPAGLLGKSRAIELTDTRGRYGPDNEHFLINTLSAAARANASPACQRLLGNLATAYLLQRTAEANWSTSGIFSAREIGWEGINVVHWYYNLRDRELAAAVVQRWYQRWRNVIKPYLNSRVHSVWDVRIDDGRVGSGAWWLAFQQSIAAYGLDFVCEVVGPAEGRAYALSAAKMCLYHEWIWYVGRWRGLANVPYTHVGKPPTAPYEPVPVSFWNSGNVGPDWWSNSWAVPSVAVVLRHEPTNERALSIMWQVLNDFGNAPRSWLPPGFLPISN